MSQNKIGKIKSLAFRNFLTYDELSFYPGENLNIIIGPNGTGKSTIVAGIVIGCGGDCGLLSRSKDLSDYVKNGKNKARIEIAIYSNEQEDSVIFHRAFDKESKEVMLIDGVKVNKKEYLRQIKLFNIQVDNLCMFLPQDRVQDFTMMNPQELLQNTQISVCSKEINEAFAKLIETRNKQKSNHTSRSDLQGRLEDSRNRNQQLSALIENNSLKNNLIEKVKMFCKKKSWIKYDETNNEYAGIVADVKLLTDKVKKRNEELKPFKTKQLKIAKDKAEIKNLISKTSNAVNNFTAQMDNLQDASDKTEGDIIQARQEMSNAIASVQDHKKNLQEKQDLINFEKNDIKKAQAALSSEGNIEMKMEQFNEALSKHKVATENFMQKRNTIVRSLEETILPSIRNCQRKLASLADSQHQRVAYLQNNHADVYKAYTWLQANRQNLQGRVFDPIMIEISVREKKSSKYIENTVAMRDFLSFVCTNKNDMKQLVKKFQIEMGLAVNLGFSKDTEQVELTPPCDIENYPPQLGLYSYLVDLITGPAPVINYLCRLFRIHEIVVGDDNTFLHADQVPSQIRLFFSTNHRFAVSISRYSNTKSTSSSTIQDRNLLFVGVDNRLKKREEENLSKWERDSQQKHAEKAKIESEIKRGEEEVTEIRVEKNRIERQIQTIKMSIEKLRMKEAELEAMKLRKVNVEEERQKFKNKVDELINKLLTINTRRVETLLEIKSNQVQRTIGQKKLDIFDRGTENVDEEIRKMESEIQSVSSLLAKVNDKHKEALRKLKTLEAEALSLTGGLPPSDRKFKYKKQFAELPNTLDEINEHIEEMQGRIDCIQDIDPRIVVEFEDRKREIDQMEQQLTNEKQTLEKLENDLKNLHNKWYPAIQNVMQEINQKFSNFFNKMGFVGEVEMIRKEERDYDGYGIQIRVQYRDHEKLQALNRHVQSGGERAVAIAIYTMSLQHLSFNVPFRCVDEINQGMDPKNERKIFQMLVDITCQPGQSQYFFVTPKLLPNLPYNDLMSVHIVHNGKNMEDSNVFLDEE